MLWSRLEKFYKNIFFIFKPREKNWQPMRVALQWLYPTGFWNISHLEYEYDTLCIRRLIFKTTLNLSIYISSFLYTSFLPSFFPSILWDIPLRPWSKLIPLSAFLTNHAKWFLSFLRVSDVVNHRRGLEIKADKEKESREWENREKI